MKTLVTRSVPRERFRTFLAKAREFLAVAQAAERDEQWNAAALNAIHAGISAADAVAVALLGKRSAGQRHEDAAALLKETRLSGVEDRTKQFLALLQLKNLAEYDADEPTEEQARRLVLHAARFYDWAKTVLPS